MSWHTLSDTSVGALVMCCVLLHTLCAVHVAAAASENVPLAHAVHDAELAPECLPAAQFVQL